MEGSKHTFLLIMCKIYMRLIRFGIRQEGGGARKGWRTEGVEHQMLSFIGWCVSSDAVAYRVKCKKIHRRGRWRTEGVEHRMLGFIGCCVSSDAEFHRMLSFDRMLTAIGYILEKGSAEGVTYGCCVTSDAVFQRMLRFIGC